MIKMKMDKKKWIFIGLIALVLVFMTSYYLLFLKSEGDDAHIAGTGVPELEEEKAYRDKMEAVDGIGEEREARIPEVYNEGLLDENGIYDPLLIEREKQRQVDSILEGARISYTERYPVSPKKEGTLIVVKKGDPPKEKKMPDGRAVALEQQLFFASEPKSNSSREGIKIEVRVDGDQEVRANERLRLRTLENWTIRGRAIPRNSPVYAKVGFGPNRLLLELDNIDEVPVSLEARDLADGREGIYIRNSFREDAQKEVRDDLIDDISLPGVPGVKGIKGLFKRTNRRVKVSVRDGYRLVLLAKTG